MDTNVDKFTVVTMSLSDYLLALAKVNDMTWREIMGALFLSGIFVSTGYENDFDRDFDRCKEVMRKVLEDCLKAGELIYGSKTKS